MFQNKFLYSKASLAFSLFFLFIISSTNLFADTELLKVNWKFKGITGKFDRASLQRGYQVYNEVCSSCHSMRLLSYRNLGEKGGPEFSADQVKAIAATFEVTDGPDNQGEMFARPEQFIEQTKGALEYYANLFKHDFSVSTSIL